MRMVPDEVRRARLRRGPLLVLATLALAVAAIAHAWPASHRWCGPAEAGTALVLGLAWSLAAAAAWRARSRPAWSSLDGVAWVEVVGALALVSSAAHAPVGPATLLEAIVLVLFALRDPADGLVGLAATLALVGPLARLVIARDASGAIASLLATLGSLAGFAATLVQTRRFVRARDLGALSLASNDLPRAARSTVKPPATAPTTRERVSSVRAPGTERRSDPAETGWDAIVERVRDSINALAENAGVTADVKVELSGLAPPSAKMRTHLPRIAQEATSQTLRHGEPRTISATLRRGDGGVVFELRDDGAAASSTRERRAIGTLRGRVAALGGTAEISRGDLGWVTRVRLPCDQLN